MAGKSTATAFVVLFMAACFCRSSLAATYTVGGSTGWRIPQSSNFYSDWASNNTFLVGDILVFNFNNGSHDVATVTRSPYDSCATSNTLSVQSTPPVSITLNSTGDHYYLCTVSGHCSAGQKLHVQVSSGSATSPSGSPNPTTTPSAASPSDTNAPAPSSGASFGASFLTIFAAVAAVYKLVIV